MPTPTSRSLDLKGNYAAMAVESSEPHVNSTETIISINEPHQLGDEEQGEWNVLEIEVSKVKTEKHVCSSHRHFDSRDSYASGLKMPQEKAY